MTRAARRVVTGIYVLLALPLMLFMALRIPLNEGPDEWSHVVRADGLLHGHFLGTRQSVPNAFGATDPMAGVVADFALIKAAFVFSGTTLADKVLTPDLIARQRAIPWSDKAMFLIVHNTSFYMPAFYAPAALGLGLGRLAGLGPYDSITLGRVANLLATLAFGAAALLLARRGHALIFATLTLPMTLAVGAALTQDGPMTAAACLCASLLTRDPRGWLLYATALLLAAVMAAKPPYLPLAGMFVASALLSGRSDRATLLRTATATLLAAVPVIVWSIVSSRYVATDFLRAPYLPGPNWPGDPTRLFTTVDRAAQLQVLLHDPRLAITLPLSALKASGLQTLREMIGVLGNLDLTLPGALYTIWFATLPLALLCDLPLATANHACPGRVRSWLARLLALACIVGAILTVYIGQYLTWTPVGAAVLDGFQGRYLLPALPFLAFATPQMRLSDTAAKWLPRLGCGAAAAAAAAGCAVIPTLVLATYYRL